MRDDESAREYCRKKNMLFLWNCAVTLVFLLIMVFGFSIPLRKFSTQLTENSVIVISLYFFLFYCLYVLSTFGLKYYEEVVLERKLNGVQRDFLSWTRQMLKREGLIFLGLLPAVQMIYFFLETSSGWWWFKLALLFAAGVIFFTELLPHYCLPFFCRYRPLEDKELAKRLTAMGEKVKFRFENVYVMEQHGRSPAVVLFGIGPVWKLMLGDTMMEYAKEEIEVVVAGEIAYHYFQHGWKLIGLQAGALAAVFLVINIIFEPVTVFFGFILPYDIATLPLFAVMFFTGFFIFSLIMPNLRNRMEREADIFSLQMTQSPDAFVSLLIRQEQENLYNPSPYNLLRMSGRQSPVTQRMVIAQDYAQSLRAEKHEKKPPEEEAR